VEFVPRKDEESEEESFARMMKSSESAQEEDLEVKMKKLSFDGE